MEEGKRIPDPDIEGGVIPRVLKSNAVFEALTFADDVVRSSAGGVAGLVVGIKSSTTFLAEYGRKWVSIVLREGSYKAEGELSLSIGPTPFDAENRVAVAGMT